MVDSVQWSHERQLRNVSHPARVEKALASQRSEAMTMTKTRDQVLKLKTEGKNCLPAQTKVVLKPINALVQWLTTRFTVNVCFRLRESPLLIQRRSCTAESS